MKSDQTIGLLFYCEICGGKLNLDNHQFFKNAAKLLNKNTANVCCNCQLKLNAINPSKNNGN